MIVAGAAALGLVLATAPAVMAQETPEYGVTTTTISQTECGTATITWTNPTQWAFTADYRLEGEEGTADQWSNQRISEGPLAGQKFAKQFHPIALPAGGSSDSVTVTLDPGTETVNVKAWVKRGPEQRSFSSASAELKPCAPAEPPADDSQQDDGQSDDQQDGDGKTDTPPADDQADDQSAGNGSDGSQDSQQDTDDANVDGTAPTPEPQPAHIAVTG